MAIAIGCAAIALVVLSGTSVRSTSSLLGSFGLSQVDAWLFAMPFIGGLIHAIPVFDARAWLSLNDIPTYLSVIVLVVALRVWFVARFVLDELDGERENDRLEQRLRTRRGPRLR